MVRVICNDYIYDDPILNPAHRYISDYYKDDVRLLVGAEIGVYDGNNTRKKLDHFSGRLYKYYLIDPYEYYVDGAGYTKEELDKAYVSMMFNIKPFRNICRILYMKSQYAVNEVEPLDFLYIDGNHTYISIIHDLILYYQKIKVGGILSGHDYKDQFGVKDAVDQFTDFWDISFTTCGTDWWLVKEGL